MSNTGEHASVGSDQQPAFAVPPPQPFMGEKGAAPPAPKRIMAAEVLVSCEHGLPEIRERQPGLLVTRMTEGIIMHGQRERSVLQAGYGRHRAARKFIKQRAHLPVIEDAPLVGLLMSGEDVKGLHLARCDQLQYPCFRGPKAAAHVRKLFEQRDDARLELRKQAQIRSEKVVPGQRRRRTISAPRTSGEFKMVLREPDHRRVHPGQLLWRDIAHGKVQATYRELGKYRFLDAAMVEQPEQK